MRETAPASGSPGPKRPFANASTLVVALAVAVGFALVVFPRGAGDQGAQAPAPPAAPAGAPKADEDARAHLALGHREFTHAVPEELSLTRYDFVRTVERAREQRWFEDTGSYRLAVDAFARAEAFARRLASDRGFRALDGAVREIAAEQGAAFDVVFAPPYVLCMERGDEAPDPTDTVFLPREAREARLAEAGVRAALRARALAERGRFLQHLYARFFARYSKDVDLRDLMEEFGGRPDLPIGKRSFRDGCPLLVWSGSGTVDEDPTRHVHFDPRAERLYVVGDPPPLESELRGATAQILHWFRRQKSEWGRADSPQSFFEVGFPSRWATARLLPDRTLEPVEPGLWLERLRTTQTEFTAARQTSPRFPLKALLAFDSYPAVTAYAAEHWGPVGAGNGLQLFAGQARALLTYLDGDERHRAAFNAFVRAMFDVVGDRDPSHAGRVFEQLFKLHSDDDWRQLDDEFRAYWDRLLAAPAVPTPARPALADWPGYVPPEVFGVAARR